MVESSGSSNLEGFAAAASRHSRKPPRLVERYWLCDRCATGWTLIQDRSGGIALTPLSRAPVHTPIPIQAYRGVL